MSEHSEQAALFDWARIKSIQFPALKMLLAIPNGGQRHIAVAKKLKREGVKAGMPDIFLAVPDWIGGPQTKGNVRLACYGGLFIEMKFGKNKLTKEQKECIEALRTFGYRCEVCYSFEEARNVICHYLGIEDAD